MRTCKTCKEIKPLTEFYKLSKCKARPNRTGHSTECKECFKARSKRNSSKEYRRYHHVYFRYGISKDQYDNLLKTFPVCASCHEDFGAFGPTVDHCHTTGRVRSLLCLGCNAGLGNYKESKEKLALAIIYLDNYA